MPGFQDQILVARNPAGRVDAAFVQEIMLFEAFLGLKSVYVIHHTGKWFPSRPLQPLMLIGLLQTVAQVISKTMRFVNFTRTDCLIIRRSITWSSVLLTSKLEVFRVVDGT
jgi:hypothetical protein